MDILFKQETIKTIKTINFSELVKNSKTKLKLSLNCESKMIDLLNNEFTEEESQWYIANLYMYLNYHSTTDYPINLEHVYKMIGFANKGNAMKTIKSNFTENEDYTTLLFHTEKQKKDEARGGHNKEDIMLNIDTFKNLCMIAKTPQGKQIRKYYMKLENIHNKIIKEEIEEQKSIQEQMKKQLEEKEQELENTKKQLEIKTKLAVKKWYDQEPGDVIYGCKSNKDDSNSLITVGKSKNIKKRESSYFSCNQDSEMFYIRKCYNCDLTEKVLHHILDKYREESNKEWFNISEELTIYMIDLICDFLDKFIYCSEKLPEFKIKEFIDNLEIKHFDTHIVLNKPILDIPTIVYNNELKNYDKFILDYCEIDSEYYSLPYDLIAAYRMWCKGDMTREIKKEFLNYIKTKYISKDRYIEEYGTRAVYIFGIRPKILEFNPDNLHNIKKYEEFIIDKCNIGYTLKIGYNIFIQNYTEWLQSKYPNYKINKQHEIELKEYFNKKFLICNIPGTKLGMWGIQLKTDKLPRCGLINQKTCKKIYKINVDTKNIIETYSGLSEASEKLNISVKTISDNIRFNKTFNEQDIRILLKYEENDDNEENDNEENEDDNEENDNKVVFNKRITLKKIYKINYDTKDILDEFDGLIGASKKLNISTTTIAKYIKNNKQLTINNIKIILSYTKIIEENKNETKENTEKVIFNKRIIKKIYKINNETNEILDTFLSISDAATKLNIAEVTVSRYIKSMKTFKDKNNITYRLEH